MLTKHQLVIAVLEWPIEAASQGAAALPRRAMPRGLEQAEEPRPPVPIRLCADNCTGPWESPKQEGGGDIFRSPRGVGVANKQTNNQKKLVALDEPGRLGEFSFGKTKQKKIWRLGNLKLCHSGGISWSLIPLSRHRRHQQTKNEKTGGKTLPPR